MNAATRQIAQALIDFYGSGSQTLIDAYSATALKRVWKAVRFSWWFTQLMHRFPGEDAFTHKVQMAELDYLSHSKAASTALAENYVGLPF